MFCAILYATIEVLTVVPVKIGVIQDVSPCSLVEKCPDGVGSRFVLYVATLVTHYTASHTRRQ
jgi:hypothetical protein